MLEEFHIANDWNKFEQYRKNESRGLKTGFKQLDRQIIGLPGLVTVMGEPKSCKSTFVMAIALMKAREGYPVIFVDSENGLQRTRLRMLCYLSELVLEAIKGRASPGELVKYNEAVTEMESLPIYYFDKFNKVEELEALVKELGAHYQKHVVLVLDSLQNFVSDFKDRRSSIDYWVFALNDLKKKYENWITILLVSEKNRQFYGASSKAGAKESGGIEYKSEMVIDLWPNETDEYINVQVLYNRDGQTGIGTRLVKPRPYNYKLLEMEELPE